MHGNLTYLQEGAALLKRLVAGDCNRGTLHGTLKEHWKYSRVCYVETSPGVYQVVRNISNETAWDLSYKQLWVFVLRHFAELGGRAPLKEAGMYPYKASERPNLIRRLLDFAMDLGFEIATLEEISDVPLKLPVNEEAEPKPEPKSYVDECEKSTTDLNDRRRRCGVPYTRAYDEGKAGFYLSKILMKGIEDSDNMPSTSFIRKDFIEAFFGPTPHIWEELRNVAGTVDGREALSECDLSLLEENLDTEHTNPATGGVQSSPAPTLPVDQHDFSPQMAGVQHLSRDLDALCERIWDMSPAHLVDALTQKSSELSMRSAVHQALEGTARYLSQQQESNLLNIQSKLCEFIRAAYGALENDKNQSRWQKLRDTDCASFLLIGLSYTPLEIGEMCQTQFNYLTANITKFQQTKTLPPKWFFVTEIQLAVAAEFYVLLISQ